MRFRSAGDTKEDPALCGLFEPIVLLEIID